MINVEKEKKRYFIITCAIVIIGFMLSGVLTSIDSGSKVRFIFILISIIAIYVYLFIRLKNYMEITKSHEEVDSVIQEMQVKFDDNDRVRFSMLVKYSYNGNDYMNKIKATNYEFEEFKPGDHIGVYVYPKNPKNAELRIKDLPGYGCLSVLVVTFLIIVVYPIVRFIVTSI